MTEEAPTRPEGRWSASLIIPAYNEEGRFAPLLELLGSLATSTDYLVVIACNGCRDRTVEMARATPGVHVLDDEVASKPRALNRAEAYVGDVFPRLYVDADVRTDADSIHHLLDALRVDEPRAVRPVATYIQDGAPWLCRAYYESRTVIPSSRRWLDTHIEGHHIYGTNRAGRARFDLFPEEGQIMEDAFFDRMFDTDQKVAVRDAHVLVPLPPTSRALLRAMTRTYQGNWELDEWLARHRPDRAAAANDAVVREGSGPVSLARGLVGSWSPHAISVGLGTFFAREVSKWNARRFVRAGRQSDWR